MKNKLFLILLSAAIVVLAVVIVQAFAQSVTNAPQERIVVIPTIPPTPTASIDTDKQATIQLLEYVPIVEPTPTQRLVNGKKLTDAERTALVKIAEAEASTEGLHGKALVMLVVINRAECEYEFENDVVGVIFEKGQFSPVRPGCRYWTTTPDDECYEALELVLSGWDESRGALYFEGHKTTDNWHWRNLDFLFKYGSHRFYK